MDRRTPSSPLGAPLNSLDWALGLRVKVTTLLDDTITGQIFAYDPLSSVLTLITTPDAKPGHPVDLRFLKTSFLKDVVDVTPGKKGAVGPGKGYANQEWAIGKVDTAIVGRREREVVRGEVEREQRIGKGVSREGQEIFDALSRTMPCRWAGKDIVVLESVVISDPYGADNVKGNEANAVKRVKTVLEGERRKLQSAKRATPVPVSGERKGG
ncbi:hypothetical protein EX30DRAFT_399364 [Ascodesmis nigricans]|uniref:AD domain-containing protein n=1 Tax=Ascodesmis nigricans TaxID=341454 RepID=A0A4S2MHG2_9PEZI|nr:hypothetical protein EX30DRAFT_399364 [Ascodesmis nigricans]